MDGRYTWPIGLRSVVCGFGALSVEQLAVDPPDHPPTHKQEHRPRARGRTARILKPFSNLTVIVREREEQF